MPKAKMRGTRKSRDKKVQRAPHRGRPRSRLAGLASAEAAERACHELGEITGLKPEHVTSVSRPDDDTWKVTVELLELRRVPDTDDLIGSYEVELDETGELVAYCRVGRYSRCQLRPDEGGGDFDGDASWRVS